MSGLSCRAPLISSADADAAIRVPTPVIQGSAVAAISAIAAIAARPALAPSSIDTAVLIAGCYVLLQEAYRTLLMRGLPKPDADCGNQPCWRACIMFLPQLLGFPLSLGTALAQHNFSTLAWCEHDATHDMPLAMRVGCLLFYWFLLVDFAYQYAFCRGPPVLSDKMAAHHVVCLLGHTYALHLAPRGTLPTFLVAIMALEIGSNSANVCFLLRAGVLVTGSGYKRFGELWYLCGMTISNSVTVYMVWLWVSRGGALDFHWAHRWIPCTVLCALVYLRQLEALRVTRIC